MRYPIFVIDGDDVAVYNNADEHWNELEPYDIEHFVVFDTDGRVLTPRDAGHDRVMISDLGGEPQPEWLRQTLLDLLRRRGQDWRDDAPLEGLVIAAQAARLEAPRSNLGQAVTRLLSFVHPKRRKG